MFTVDSLLERIAAFIPVLLSLTVHEWAHAWTAWRLGDDTAKMLGRVSLNPLVHIDPIGTLLLPLCGVPFGWAKPVPVNPVRFRPSVSMSLGMLLTAAAGPISNLVIAATGCAALAGLAAFFHGQQLPPSELPGFETTWDILVNLVVINVMLALFNLLPIPPLDGGRIVDALMPTALRPYWSRVVVIGPFLLAAIILIPIAYGVNIFSWPLARVNDLLGWLSQG